jgi:hypothetical protein
LWEARHIQQLQPQVLFCTTIPVYITEDGFLLVEAVVSTTFPSPRVITLMANNGSTITALYPFCTTILRLQPLGLDESRRLSVTSLNYI